MAKKSTMQTGETEEKKVPTMFRARGQRKSFYVNKAISDYIKAEAEIKTILKMEYVDGETLDKIKKAVEKDINDMYNELYSYLSEKPIEKEPNKEYEELIKNLDKEQEDK